jgi:methylmalonyl-CoA epimerase
MSKIHHIGIAVRNIAEAARLYEALGLAVQHVETVESQGAKVAFLPIGDTEIELLEPLAPETTVGQCIEKRGEGVHHIAIEVADIRAAMAKLREQGARLLSEQPQPGAGGTLVAFVHPRSTCGVLLELCQKPQ